jgi:UrcA family protein
MTTLTARIASVATLALAFTPAVALSTNAYAAAPHTSVQVSDLNLDSASGQAVSAQRLDAAARRFCSRETTLDLQAACAAGVRDEVNAKIASGVRYASR